MLHAHRQRGGGGGVEGQNDNYKTNMYSDNNRELRWRLIKPIELNGRTLLLLSAAGDNNRKNNICGATRTYDGHAV